MSSSTSEGVTREEIHCRRIEMRGFRRSDGLYEVEGHILDRKPHEFVHVHGRTVPPNAPIHDMGVRIVFDLDMRIHEIHTFTDSAPYPQCPEGGRALQSLVGLRMAGGWNKEVRSRLSGARSCTHLMEILGPMATTAFQSLGYLRVAEPDRIGADGRPVQIDSCYAYGAGRDLVLKRWPQFHRPEASAGPADANAPGAVPASR